MGTERRKFFKKAAALAAGTGVGLATGKASIAATKEELEAFVSLSSTLTGVPASDLPAMVEVQDFAGSTITLREAYLVRLHTAIRSELNELLAAWQSIRQTTNPEASLAEKLKEPGAGRLRAAARQVIKIWYLSTIDKGPPKSDGTNNGQLGGDLGQYQYSVFPELIGAPVQGYSNKPHGYWSLKPVFGKSG